MKTIIISLGVLCAFGVLAHAQDVTKATATLEPKSGSQVTGTVTFAKSGDEVQVVADVQNLKPGKHGFHIHEKGDCSAPDAMSAGGHFNPMHEHHGGPHTAERHVGDFGNIGKSVIVHEKEDDLKTDPSGNSGTRIACGVIEAAK
jgi:superoxide dismutase, Cu-Zn family